KLVAEATGKLTSMLDGVKENDALVQGIAQASQEQSSAIEQVTTAIDQIVEIFVTHAAPSGRREASKPVKPAAAAPVAKASRAYLTEGSAALKADWSEF